jgi:DNA-binding CsgD family transcriptional regulator
VPDLAALNPGEREALGLLAQGHTAKSIASLTGRSVASVNERLREARRKTGVGSSRELARMLATQENRDEEIGVAPVLSTGAALPLKAAPRFAGGAFGKALIAMTLLLAGTAALALALRPAPQSVPAPDPMLDKLIGAPATTAPQLHERLRNETRDPVWAEKAEATLAKRYAAIPLVEGGPALRVICARALCEVTGSFQPKSDVEGNATMDLLQGPALHGDIRKLGFGDVLLQGFGGERGDTRTRFVAYWPRSGG